jgi:hypothetical protein
MSEINWIVNRHNTMMMVVTKCVPVTAIVDIISKYTLGFVNIGKLNDQLFISQELVNNYTTCQIKYINGLSFIDFWRVESYDDGGKLYPRGWNVNHYSYIYKNHTEKLPKLYREKVQFFLLFDNYDIMASKPSLPIYDMKKLSHEEFVEFDCPPDWISMVNNHPVSDYSDQQEITSLFSIFESLTENKPCNIYERTASIF